ncbi:FYN-binding protein 1-like [Hypomesus transpacificus]|uniref:FYN-binding protein 1-like n=1 Tax=Hypomesus transpacificus TaxID=137520 RepID=UPI001F086D54|nr:FYN-binding protein 1-like [Hypomesus transpacificus]
MDNLKKTPSMGTIITATTQASKPAFRRTFDTPVREGPEATVPKPPPFKPKFTETNQDAKSQKPGFSSQPKPPLSALKLPLTPIRKSSLMSGLQAQQGQEIQRGEHWTPPTPKPPTPQTPPKPQQGGGRGWGHAVRGAFRSSFIHSVPPKPPAAKKPSFAPGPSGGRERLVHQQKSDNPSAPKKKTVPDAFTLGNPPMKPNRPTHIDLQRFQQGGKGQNGGCLETSGCPVTLLRRALPAPYTGPSLAESPLPEHESHDDLTSLLQLGSSSNKESGDKNLPEVYDDVGTCSGLEGEIVGDDVYSDVGPAEELFRFPPPPPIEELYDDVDSASLILKGKVEQMDPKMKKKFEKEEKEFRKKFHFKGDIQVLYDVTIVTPLFTKKWGTRDLHLKPGEVIKVIVRPDKGVLIGRNNEGKFGYVSTNHVAQDAGDVYDDIGEDCIYDND